ncbi:transposase-like zinc-binding domain-containing protein [Desulfothermus naphthae]
MVVCKHCNSTQVVKNGFVRKKQLYLGKNCSRTLICCFLVKRFDKILFLN